MSLYAFLGTLEIGFIYGLVAMGVYLTFRILDFPDLTVDGSFTLGAAATATLIVMGVNPYLSTLIGALAAACAGIVTAWLNLRFNILHLLASILTMTALYTINLRVMGKPNVALIMEPTMLTPFLDLGIPAMYMKVIFVAICAVIGGLIVSWFLYTQYGLAMRAVGSNKRMAQANGIVVNEKVYVGLALSNGLVGLAGALFAQTNGFADSTMGIGTIVVGLAAVIVGESLFATRSMLVIVMSCILGSILYRIAVSMALNTDFLGFQASDVNLLTAVLVALALVFPKLRSEYKAKKAKEARDMIRCENLHVTFNHGLPTEKLALQGIDLTIPTSQFVTVIGSNGAGKSTLLNTIAGDIETTHGRIFFGDRDVTKLPATGRTKDIARVFQDPLAGTCGNLTVEENMALAYGRGTRGTLAFALNAKLRKIFQEQLSRLNLGLEDRLDAQMGLLSGGQRQSVSLLMSALQPSTILLLDEHTAALDPKTAALIMDISSQIIEEKKLTVLMVTHSMRQALDHGSRTIMLHEGKIIFDLEGGERSGYEVKDLLNLFALARNDGEELDDDKLLLDS